MKRLLIAGTVGAAALVIGIAVAMATTGAKATVSVKTIAGAGKVLVDARGRALYMNDQERGGKVLCVGPCLSFWRPLTVSGAPKASLPGKLAVAKRPDGRSQVTYNGKLLYSFTLDKPGKVTGNGFKDAFGSQKFTWRVAHPTKTTATAVGAATTTTNPYPGYQP